MVPCVGMPACTGVWRVCCSSVRAQDARARPWWPIQQGTPTRACPQTRPCCALDRAAPYVSYCCCTAGDVVDVAYYMEATGSAMAVHVSQTTMQLLTLAGRRAVRRRVWSGVWQPALVGHASRVVCVVIITALPCASFARPPAIADCAFLPIHATARAASWRAP